MTGSNQVSNVVSSVVTPVALSGVKTPLLNQFEGAAAAYSLRRLKSWDDGGRVVRVRRESDNTERDFSSVEVSDGAMARWVNEQPTLPLDLRELDTNTGERDGALIEAAAAYSLRKLKEDFTGDVVEVRRNVDGETEGFTAAEVTDGTMESFVKGWEEYSLATAKNYTTHSFEEFSSPSSNGFTALNSSAEAFAGWDIPSGSAGDLIEVSFDINIISGTPRVQLRPEYDDRKIRSDIFEIGTSGSYTATLKATGDYSFISFSDGDVPSEFTVSNFKVYNNSVVNELPLDQATGAAAAYSLRSLGSNQWTYGGDTLEYESDFSAGTDGWGSQGGTVAGNIDSIGGQDDNLRFTDDGTTGGKVAYGFQITAGKSYLITADYYIPSTNAVIDEVRVNGRGGTSATGSVTDEWASISLADTPSSTGFFYITGLDGGAGSVVGNGTDVFYIRNVKVYETTGDTEYLPSGKYVVQVRRSSDDAVKSFTAAEVANGTLESWVDADVVTYESDFSANTDGWNSQTDVTWSLANGIGGQDDNLALTIGNDDSGHSALRRFILGPYFVEDVVDYDWSMDVYVPSSNTLVDGVRVNAGGTVSTFTPTQDQWVTISGSTTSAYHSYGYINLTDGGATEYLGNGTDLIYVRNVAVTQTLASGHVKTWYDQSGSDNHAVQTDTAKQPKIVEGGTVLKDGNNVPQVRFDGAQNLVKTTFTQGTLNKPISGFAVFEKDAASDYPVVLDSANGGARFSLESVGLNVTRLFNGATLDSPTAIGEDKSLVSLRSDGANSYVAVNGGSPYSDPSHTGNHDMIGITIGSRHSNDGWLNGEIQEVIIYPSDQTDKRRAIEENIANHYDISLATFSRDGTVKTWYDQTESRTDDPQNITGFLVERSNDIMNGEWDKVADVNGKVAFTHEDDANRTLNWNGTRWEFKDSSTVYYYSTVDTTYPFDVSNEWVAVEGSGTPDFESFDGGWYDPLGRGGMLTMHADVFQPTIVRDGTYLGEIDFDESNDKLNAHFELDIDPADSGFASIVVARVDSTDTTSKQTLLQNSPSGSRHLIQWQANGRYQFYAKDAEGDTKTFITNDSFGNDEYKVFTTTIDSNSLCRANVNGFGEVNHRMNDSVDFGSVDSTANSDEVVSPSGNPFMGAVKEMIFYLSDQSANRTAIEANIGETYGITAIPAANDTVNGYVQTWYDQSGSGNDAEQTTASSQPKIVDGGSLVSGGIDFDGVGQKLQTPTTSALNIDGAKDKSIFAKGTFTASEDFVFLGNASPIGEAIRYRSSGGNARFEVQGGGVNGGSILGADGAVYSSIFSGTQLSDADVSSNGSITDATGTLAINTADTVLFIGYVSGGFNEGAGQLSEIIIYDSNQSANRPAIEANINNQYDIY